MDFPDLSTALDAGYEDANRGGKSWPTYDGAELDRSKFVTASEVTKCARKIKFEKAAPPVPFTDWGYAERGHMIEAWAAPLLKHGLGEVGVELTHYGEHQVSYHAEYQSGTPDGLLWPLPKQVFVLDAKSIDPRTNYMKLPKDGHVEQVQQNMDLVDRCTPDDVIVVGGILLYIDASNLQKRRQINMAPDFDMQEHLESRATEIMTATDPMDLKPEGMYKSGGCARCAFTERCSDKVKQTKEQDALMKAAAITAEAIFNQPK